MTAQSLNFLKYLSFIAENYVLFFRFTDSIDYADFIHPSRVVKSYFLAAAKRICNRVKGQPLRYSTVD